MAIIFLPLDGVGLGHLARAFSLAEYLQSAGEAPVIFAQGEYPEFMRRSVPGVSVGTVYKSTRKERGMVSAALESYARLTWPPVLIEDTHPAPVLLGSNVFRFLIVRPTTIEYMRSLRTRYSTVYRAFLVADDPDSPTWPFSGEQTREIEGWPSWICIGPLYRRSTIASERRMRRKYSLGSGVSVYVFSMGGGGSQESALDEAGAFCAKASVIAESIRRAHPASRLMFVRGPLFPKSLSVPEIFEDIPTEDDMPSLIALAAGAIVRPGYNTTWECIVGRTPFIALTGATFVEPVAERLRRLGAFGLLAESIEQWADPKWSKRFQRTCRWLRSRWGCPVVGEKVRKLIKISGRSSSEEALIRIVARSPPTASPKAKTLLLIRIDDVTEVDNDLLTAMRICASWGLHVSLEVIPYLCRVDEVVLRRIAGGVIEFEVAQHGYAHLPQKGVKHCRAEFAEADMCEQNLRLGLAIMNSRFPTTFRGGFSAPYEPAPPSLCAIWFGIGGRYVSLLHQRCAKPDTRAIRLTADLWDWNRDAPRALDTVITEVTQAGCANGYAGLVLHPRMLRLPGEARRLDLLLEQVMSFGFRPALVSKMVCF